MPVWLVRICLLLLLKDGFEMSHFVHFAPTSAWLAQVDSYPSPARSPSASPPPPFFSPPVEAGYRSGAHLYSEEAREAWGAIRKQVGIGKGVGKAMVMGRNSELRVSSEAKARGPLATNLVE